MQSTRANVTYLSSAFCENSVIGDIRLFVGRTKYDHVGYPRQKVSLEASFLRCDYEGLDSVNPNPNVTLPSSYRNIILHSLESNVPLRHIFFSIFCENWVISDIRLVIGRTKYDHMG